MRGEDHYAALGLRPGAGPAEIADAYRRLIKRYHPDRTGGDASKAAEINRAYSELRRNSAARQWRPPMPMQPPARRRRRSLKAPFFLVVAAMFTGAAASQFEIMNSDEFLPLAPQSYDYEAIPAAPSEQQLLVDFDSPLSSALVSRGIEQAFDFHVAGAIEEAVQFSRQCHDSLARNPSLAWFDSCAAFDESMMRLRSERSDAASRPFSWSAVVGRELAAARTLVGDPVAADSRLNAIRLQVDLRLLPRLDSAAATPAA